jgi:putative transcriptional regulator
VHETAKGRRKAGAVDATTMRDFDALFLPPVKHYSAGQIKKLRLRYKANQAVFAAYLNTSPSTVQKWGQGKKQPNGTSLKLLNIVDQKGLDALG